MAPPTTTFLSNGLTYNQALELLFQSKGSKGLVYIDVGESKAPEAAGHIKFFHQGEQVVPVSSFYEMYADMIKRAKQGSLPKKITVISHSAINPTHPAGGSYSEAVIKPVSFASDFLRRGAREHALLSQIKNVLRPRLAKAGTTILYKGCKFSNAAGRLLSYQLGTPTVVFTPGYSVWNGKLWFAKQKEFKHEMFVRLHPTEARRRGWDPENDGRRISNTRDAASFFSAFSPHEFILKDAIPRLEKEIEKELLKDKEYNRAKKEFDRVMKDMRKLGSQRINFRYNNKREPTKNEKQDLDFKINVFGALLESLEKKLKNRRSQLLRSPSQTIRNIENKRKAYLREINRLKRARPSHSKIKLQSETYDVDSFDFDNEEHNHSDRGARYFPDEPWDAPRHHGFGIHRDTPPESSEMDPELSELLSERDAAWTEIHNSDGQDSDAVARYFEVTNEIQDKYPNYADHGPTVNSGPLNPSSGSEKNTSNAQGGKPKSRSKAREKKSSGGEIPKPGASFVGDDDVTIFKSIRTSPYLDEDFAHLPLDKDEHDKEVEKILSKPDEIKRTSQFSSMTPNLELDFEGLFGSTLAPRIRTSPYVDNDAAPVDEKEAYRVLDELLSSGDTISYYGPDGKPRSRVRPLTMEDMPDVISPRARTANLSKAASRGQASPQRQTLQTSSAKPKTQRPEIQAPSSPDA